METTARVRLTGAMPLLSHADNIDWADQMEEWKNDPDNKAKSKAGDDRTPPWRWLGCLNYDDPVNGVVTIPTDYLMPCMRDAAADVPTGKGKKTFKAQSQSGLLISELHWPLLINGKPISMASLAPFRKPSMTFAEHRDGVMKLGFSLFVKRAKVGMSKHIRVRPRFDNWSIEGDILILDDQITLDVLKTILQRAGRYRGLGDWRPGSPSRPGPFGTFTSELLN